MEIKCVFLIMEGFKRFFPILSWLPSYQRRFFAGDFSAGLTVGVLLIPQGMAYAMIAGLPPVYGLYAALIPQIIYAIFGTSRQLAVGPVAMDSLLVAAGVSTLASVGSDKYLTLAILLAFMVGVFQLLLGLFRIGFLVNFLSKPVISGFTSAAALIIGVHQLKYLLGVQITPTYDVFSVLLEVFSSIKEVNFIAVLLATFGIFILKKGKFIHPQFPSALVAVAVGIVVTSTFSLQEYGVKIVGDIPRGLPHFKVPVFTLVDIMSLFPIAIALALIAFMEAISIAKGLESEHKGEYKLDNNQEMIGLGLSNLLGSFFMSYPTTGGFSRSAVNNQAGANTNLASLISALLVALVLIFFSSWFFHLPEAILGGVIFASVIGLVDINYPKYLWKTNKQDFIMFLVTFVVTVGVGIQHGITAGVSVSLLMLIYRTSSPHIAVLGEIKEINEYRNVKRFNDAVIRKDVLILRQDGQLFFANVTSFVNRVHDEVDAKGKSLKLLVFDCSSVSSVDATALQELRELVQDLNKKGVGMYFSGLVGPVRDFFYRTEFIQEVGTHHFFIDVQQAINYLDSHAKSNSKQMFRHALQTNVFDDRQ